MSEWEILGVIAAAFTFIASVTLPVIKLTKTITKLDVSVDNLNKMLATHISENKDSNDEIWEEVKIHGTYIAEHDKALGKHELRLTNLEKGKVN